MPAYLFKKQAFMLDPLFTHPHRAIHAAGERPRHASAAHHRFLPPAFTPALGGSPVCWVSMRPAWGPAVLLGVGLIPGLTPDWAAEVAELLAGACPVEFLRRGLV